MRRTDYIYLHTAGLLQAPAAKSAQLLHDLEEIFELKEPGKPGRVSLAGRGSQGEALNFHDWVKALWQEGVVSAAFTDGDDLLLRVVTQQADRLYILRAQFSSAYGITANAFVELMDAQDHSPEMWDRVTELVTESNELNGRPRIERAVIRDYLTSRGGADVFAFLVSELVSEIQVDCGVAGVPFRIPAHLQSLFYQSPFSFGSPDEDDQVYLYRVQAMTGPELLALVEAQSFAGEIWEKAVEEFADYTEIPVLPVGEYPGYIAKETDAMILDRIGNSLTTVIRDLCEDRRCQPVIPPALRDHVGPSEEEAARARMRSKLDREKWYLAANEQPWELYFFERFQPEEPLAKSDNGNGQRSTQETTRQAFGALLPAIAAFAKKMDNAFSEAFELGAWFLGEKGVQLVEAAAGEEQAAALLDAALVREGFSVRARENAGHCLYIIAEAKTFDWPAVRISGLLAYDITDVFGGMGSWNDIVPDNEEDYEQYQTLSTELFVTRKAFFAALLSGV